VIFIFSFRTWLETELVFLKKDERLMSEKKKTLSPSLGLAMKLYNRHAVSFRLLPLLSLDNKC
jgi:hypothetical protein